MAGNHFDCSKPHLMSSFTDQWPCRSWTFNTLADLLGNKKFSCRVIPKSCDRKMETQCSHQDVTIKEFCDWLDGTANDSSPLSGVPREENSCYIDYKYMKDVFEEHPDMFKEVRWEDFGLVGFSGYDSTIWLSSEGANTPGHQDTYGFNLITQIYGRKLWILFPPEDSSYLYPTRVPYEESSIFTEVNIRKPDLHSHPQFKLSHPYVVTLQPGQTLYVPRHWWHYVESLEPSISVNVWLPLREDKDSRFSEAITRCLATSLISSLDTSYSGCQQSEWLNPTETLAPTTMNLLLLKASLCQLLEDSNDGGYILNTDEKQEVNEDSLYKNELTQHSDLSRGSIQGEFSQELKQRDLSYGVIQQGYSCSQAVIQGDLLPELVQQGDLLLGLVQQSDLSPGLVQQGDLSPGLVQQGELQHRLIHKGDFQKDPESQPVDDSEPPSLRNMSDNDIRTCQHVQKDAYTNTCNVLTSIDPAGQSERAPDESMLGLFIDKMKGYRIGREDTPFQCDFEVSLPLKNMFEELQGSSPKKVKISAALAETPSNSTENSSTESSYSRTILLLSPCSLDTYLKFLDNLCRQNQCRQCCMDSRAANNITFSNADRNRFPAHITATSSNVSQHKSGGSLETADVSSIRSLKDVHNTVSDSRKRKTSFDFKDEECGGTSGDGSGMEDNCEGDNISVDSGSLVAEDCSQVEVAETLLSCTLHPCVVKLISQLFRDKYQHRLTQYK